MYLLLYYYTVILFIYEVHEEIKTKIIIKFIKEESVKLDTLEMIYNESSDGINLVFIT